MTAELIVRETKWYLALQDGRADNNEYDTKKEAEEALKKISKNTRHGICIQSVTRERKPNF